MSKPPHLSFRHNSYKSLSVRAKGQVLRANLGSIEPSDEESLKLSKSIATDGFLRNIEEYGKARMARRAVGVLAKMPAYRQMPGLVHYNAAIRACENSDQYKLAVSVFEEMKLQGVKRSVVTYEILTAIAEREGSWEDALDYLAQMTAENIRGTTVVFNNCMWATDKGGHPEIALSLLARMEAENIPRDEVTYAACIYACESAGQGTTALHVMDLMQAEGIAVNAPVYQAAIWACVKEGIPDTALRLYDEMESKGLSKTAECYNGAIWACEQLGDAKRAVDLLKRMKTIGEFTRQTISYDGTLSALSAAGDWEACLDVLSWMDREATPVEKSGITYDVVIQALDAADQIPLVTEIYLRALRDGYFVPWIKGTRRVDLTRLSLPVAKAAMRNILWSFQEGKLAPFNLIIIVGEGDDDHVTDHVTDHGSSGGLCKDISEFLLDQQPKGSLIHTMQVSSGHKDPNDPDAESVSLQTITINRETIVSWINARNQDYQVGGDNINKTISTASSEPSATSKQ